MLTLPARDVYDDEGDADKVTGKRIDANEKRGPFDALKASSELGVERRLKRFSPCQQNRTDTLARLIRLIFSD